MARKQAILSDIDGTLVFHARVHGIEKAGVNADGTVLVRDPLSGLVHSAYDVSVGDYQAYLAVETCELAHQLRTFYDIIAVTGARPSTVRARQRWLDFVDTTILESGGMIVDADLVPDREWHDILQKERVHLSEVSRWLEAKGWILDNEGRTSAIRVRREDNPQKSEHEFLALKAIVDLPPQLRATSNLGHFDVVLNSAGKGNAAQYLIRTRSYDPLTTVAIGDDINDLDFLRIAQRAFVLRTSFPEVVCEANARGWYISKAPHIEGINEVLRTILADRQAG